MSPRQQVFMELLQTESNYVGILNTIVTVSIVLPYFLFPLHKKKIADLHLISDVQAASGRNGRRGK